MKKGSFVKLEEESSTLLHSCISKLKCGSRPVSVHTIHLEQNYVFINVLILGPQGFQETLNSNDSSNSLRNSSYLKESNFKQKLFQASIDRDLNFFQTNSNFALNLNYQGNFFKMKKHGIQSF